MRRRAACSSLTPQLLRDGYARACLVHPLTGPDGTYTGTVNDCKIAFTVVAQQCRKIAPKVRMFLTPNIDGAFAATCQVEVV